MVPRAELERGQRGQASPEYVALVLLLAALAAALVTLGVLPGAGVARAVAGKLICAVEGECAGGAAAEASPLELEYGGELAELLAGRAPEVSFEDDEFVSLPVDYRECRQRSCSDSILHGSLEHTQAGLVPTAFTHVVDCRDGHREHGAECGPGRTGNVYLQYWLYYPESWTRAYQRWGFHEDDWESYQVRIGPDGSVDARASSHHGYNGRSGGLGSVGSDLGKTPRPAWEPSTGQLHVAAGSHAGMSAAQEGDSRRIEPGNLRLVPLEPIAEAGGAPPFAISPPWEKEVWDDPEAMGT